MGYHSGQSEQLPTKFICFDCRVRADRNWDLIVVHGLHTPMMERFRDLALFRSVSPMNALTSTSLTYSAQASN